MKKVWLAGTLSLLMVSGSQSLPAYGENRIAEWLRFRLGTETVHVPAGQLVTDSYNLKRGDKLEVVVSLSDDSVAGIGAMICPVQEFDKLRDGVEARFCGGFQKADQGGQFVYEAVVSGKHMLAIDNSFAVLFGKSVTYEVYISSKPESQVVRAFKTMLDEIYAFIDSQFSFPPFDMSIEPCYDLNAFSDNRTGNITLWSELLFESGRLIEPGAIDGIVYHELAHTLLNL